MLRFTDFSLSRGVKPLFEHVSFALNPGEHAGLIGANGAGKSTLFSVLLGRLHPDGGDVDWPASWRVAHVAQETPALDRSALDYALDGDVVLREIEQDMATAETAGDGHALALAHTAYADADGYTARARAETLLAGLGFTPDALAKSVASFSGGWRMRLNLAQALMCRSDLLLLDEPTNHLDLDAIVWLEDWLRRYPGTLLVISHDREFLDAVTQVTLHIEQRQVRRYGGNYSQFEVLRAQQIELQQSAFEKQQKTIAHLQSFIDRFKAKATKAKQAQSRVKALERLERVAPVLSASEFTFEFRTPDAAPNPLLVLEAVRCGYRAGHRSEGGSEGGSRDGSEGGGKGGRAGETAIIDSVTLSIQSGERIGLLGANGQGKSTLIKTLAGVLAPLAGTVRGGKGLSIGYFAQHQLETLRADDTPLGALARQAGDAREQTLRDFLGSFNFRGEMATSPIGPLSGGEKARLALALLIWHKPNLLLLDEPTNHLDLETREALTAALARFEGTLILVSHDRHLLRASADSFLLVGERRVRPFDGDLDDYRDWLLAQAKAAQQADSAAAAAAGGGDARGDGRGETRSDSRRDGRRADAQARQQRNEKRRPVQRRIESLEKRLQALGEEKRALDEKIGDPASYEAANKAALTDWLKRQAEVGTELESVETEWLEAQEALEALDAG
ncbi:ATP-binding cassette domain-containing protein [Chitinasiproducens palmae]|uniref:Probable ATP-binding protein YheS n=1 Tax=Chitinasiproducens palmae TaxID=1770053 RepID=A0A1H2PLW4_9BURK|nr:ATP-binding cassette domain-containing protein [Chitinasiproducens palmae]SDV47498.1 ATP-binding cassette, subfamily F, member 3 [Chitinasiproducens palmae]